MKRISLLKKIRFFKNYKKIIKSAEFELEQKFNIRIDKAKRLYTVINIPEELVGEAFSLKKSDIDKISETYIKQYSTELSMYLTSKGLGELFKFYKMNKVSKYSYLLVFGFSLFKSQKYYNVLYYVMPAILLLISSLFIILLNF